MNSFRILILLSALSLFSCNRIANKTKEGLNKGGEIVGESATEFFDGVSEGVDKTLECKIILSDSLLKKGLKTGVYTIDTQNHSNNNKLTLYFIFKTALNAEVIAKAYNKSGLEIGRAKTTIQGQKGDAGYFEFLFDQQTDIGYRNIITID
ncbi:hypothetical protein DFQ09_102182 [Winogradskyella pacifica]|uniref:Lipoprotein n=1 Tax=Winogradskyella pacifica TaxID=664642 RepID=A0A3D9MZ70_9FLAO|nr:hypothetical protein [Winogradskyella pacifica]REE25591.1 hypothetical protein DFQ09_102182 [Winogradskyella pacifica]